MVKLEAYGGHRPQGRTDVAQQPHVWVSAVQAGTSVFWVLVGQQVHGLLLPCERGFRAREQAGERPSQPGSLSHGPAECQSCCNSAGDSMEPHQERQRDKGWLRELLLWHVIASGGGRRNRILIGYYKTLNDLMCADKYCSFSACTRKETKNIPKFLFHFCWLLCLDSARLGGEILLAKEYQGESI